MLGQFQQTNLRIEIEAPEAAIRKSLLEVANLKQWVLPPTFSQGMPEELTVGTEFTRWIGPIAVRHYVDFVDGNTLELLLSQGIDGFHRWQWGEGWIQSCLEGVSPLPLSLGHTISLLNLKRYLLQQSPRHESSGQFS